MVGVLKMDENCEVEEGEAHWLNKRVGYDINPDTDLSYIDEKIQRILGHHCRDFEVGASTDNLGPKFGGYGTFLPTYEYFPSTVSRTSQEDSTAVKSLHKSSMECPSQHIKPTSNVPPSVMLGTSSCNGHTMQNSDVTSKRVSVEQSVSSSKVAQTFTGKDESLKKPGHQRILKFRIKVSSDKMDQKKAAIYSGLGLETSPSSPQETADVSGGKKILSQQLGNKSPASLLQAMTSLPVERDVLISPLRDSLLSLTRKETLSGDRGIVSSCKVGRVKLAATGEDSVSCMGNGKLLKDKPDRLASFHNGLKGTSRGIEVSRKADNCEGSDSLVPAYLSKVEVVESISGKECDKSQKESGNSMDKLQKRRASNSDYDMLAQSRENYGKYNNKDASAPFKADSDGSKYKEGAASCSQQKGEGKSCIEPETIKVQGRTKQTSEGNKSKGKIQGKIAGVLSKESMLSCADLVPRGIVSASTDASTCANKNLKSKLHKDIAEARGFQTKSLDSGSKQTKKSLERPSSNGQKLSCPQKLVVQTEDQALSDKPKERFGGKKVDDLATPEAFRKNATLLGPCTTHGEHMPTVTDLKDNWVLCDICQKWRLLPFGTTDKDLPKRWSCSMQKWLPGLDRCEISEDETTKAVYALYQLPLPEGQHSMPENANGTESVITSVQGLHHAENRQKTNLATVSIGGKKNHSLKEKPKSSGSTDLTQTVKTLKTHSQDSMRSRSLNDNRGVVMTVKMKTKRNADQDGHVEPKKAKIDDVDVVDVCRKSDVDLGMLDNQPCFSLQTKASGKSMPKYEVSYSGDVKCDAIDKVSLSTKNLVDQPLILLDGGSSDIKVRDKGNDSVKKRKLKDNQNGNVIADCSKEERSGSEVKRLHKFRVKITDATNSGANEVAESKANKNGRVAPTLSSCKIHSRNPTEDVIRVDKDDHFRKQRKTVVSQQNSIGIDSMRCQAVSGGATSSSSKVSGSCRSGANFQELKGSPVESVSSHPFRKIDGVNGNEISVSHCVGNDGLETQCNLPVPGSKQGRVSKKLQAEGSGKVDASKASTCPLNSGNSSRGRQSLDLHNARDPNVSSLRNMKSTSHKTADSLKEALDLKQYADRIKSSGFDFESNEVSFQAALKFLHGASLLETCNGEREKHGEMQIQTYSNAAKLCEVSAHGYEKVGDKASAALAYKCMEVSYMRIVYCKYSSVTRDGNELLAISPQGESPSSSASDVDNLNNQGMDRATPSKCIASHATGNHVLDARARPQLGRLLDFTQDVNFAMEASSKALDAFASASSNTATGDSQNKKRMAAIKRVVDYSFQDVENLIRLVRLALDSINH